MSERVAIVGSRDFPALELVDVFVGTLAPDTIVISGGARGVDQRAESAARKRGLAVEVFRPDWSKGPHAGLERNALMVERADRVTAFWNGTSRGTKNSIDLARRAGKLAQLFVDKSGTIEEDSSP